MVESNDLSLGTPDPDNEGNIFPGDMNNLEGQKELSRRKAPGCCCAMPDAQTTSPDKSDRSLAYVTSVMSGAQGRVAEFYWNMIDLKVGDLCVVEDEDGLDFGSVALTKRPESACSGCSKPKRSGKVIRKATADDQERAAGLSEKATMAMAYCRTRIPTMGLEMSLSRVHFSFDGLKAVFFFTSEGRVDFRDLVRDLATFSGVRVEMRQIGVRDEAKLIGGCGPCGGQLCCSTFLSGFTPVSIRMAKDQNLSLNPAKISGVCGRLMCCLSFEHKHYKELQSQAPKLGKTVTTSDGKVGKVAQINLLKEQVVVLFEGGIKEEWRFSEITSGGAINQKRVERSTETAGEDEKLRFPPPKGEKPTDVTRRPRGTRKENVKREPRPQRRGGSVARPKVKNPGGPREREASKDEKQNAGTSPEETKQAPRKRANRRPGPAGVKGASTQSTERRPKEPERNNLPKKRESQNEPSSQRRDRPGLRRRRIMKRKDSSEGETGNSSS